MEKILLGKEDVAQLLGVHQRTVDNLVKAGKLPSSINVGRQLRWRKKDIDEWLESEFRSVAERSASSQTTGNIQD